MQDLLRVLLASNDQFVYYSCNKMDLVGKSIIFKFTRERFVSRIEEIARRNQSVLRSYCFRARSNADINDLFWRRFKKRIRE